MSVPILRTVALVLGLGAAVLAPPSFAAPQTAQAAPPAPPTVTLGYTGAFQQYVVPDGVTQLRLEMRGGEGAAGDCPGCLPDYRETNVGGGLGSIAHTHITVNPGETLRVYVGGAGSGGVGGWNGGGDGAAGGGGGGGATDIRRAPYGLDNRLVIASGGGGGGAANANTLSREISHGGAGGADRGYDGDTCFAWPLSGPYPNASGGTTGVGGNGGLGGENGTGAKGANGAKGVGGNGSGPDVVHYDSTTPWSGGGGGGGGGYYGGGGGGGSGGYSQEQTECAGGGAGGSSYPGFGPNNVDQRGNGTATIIPGIAMFLPATANMTPAVDAHVDITTAQASFTPKFTLVGTALPAGLQLVDHGDGTASIEGVPAPGTEGRYEITVRSSNPSGPAVDPLRSEQKIVIVIGSPTTRLTNTTIQSSSNPAVAGNPIEYTMTVTPVAGAETPSGTVQLRLGGAPLGAPAALTDGRAVISTSALPAGTHPISAIYSGDAVFTTSTSPTVQQIVHPRSFRPDARIRLGAGGALAGDDVFNTDGAGQSKSKGARKGKVVTFQVSIQNDGNVADRLKVRAPGSSGGFEVTFKDGTRDVTRAVVAGTWPSADLAPGAVAGLTITVKVTARAARGSSISRLLLVSSAGGGPQDAAKFRVKRSR